MAPKRVDEKLKTTLNKSKLKDRLETLQASLAAIHYHSGRCYSKTAHNSDEAELIAILRTIRGECETAIPELKGL